MRIRFSVEMAWFQASAGTEGILLCLRWAPLFVQKCAADSETRLGRNVDLRMNVESLSLTVVHVHQVPCPLESLGFQSNWKVL